MVLDKSWLPIVDELRNFGASSSADLAVQLTPNTNEGGNLIDGWLVQPLMGVTLPDVEPIKGDDAEYSLSIEDVDPLKSAHITQTTGQHYNVAN